MNRESKCGNSLLEGPGSKEEERLESHEWLHQGVEGCFPPDSDTSSSKGLRELKVREGSSAQAELWPWKLGR